jgi:hypothetical protein
MRNPVLSRVTIRGTMLYIGGSFFVLVVLMWSALVIIGIGCTKSIDTNNNAL